MSTKTLFLSSLSLLLCLGNLRANPFPLALGTSGRQNLAAKAGFETQTIASVKGYSNDDSVDAATYATGPGFSDANVQMSSDFDLDSNAVTAATEGGNLSAKGFSVSNVKSQLSSDSDVIDGATKTNFNANPKYLNDFPGVPAMRYRDQYRTFTINTNVVTGRNTNTASRGQSSVRNRARRVGVTSARSQNDSTSGAAVSSGLAVANGVVNNSKVHSQLKSIGSGEIQTKNDLSSANVGGIAGAVQRGQAEALGYDAEASSIQQGDNLGFGFTQSRGEAMADEDIALASGHIKSFFNPVKRHMPK